MTRKVFFSLIVCFLFGCILLLKPSYGMDLAVIVHKTNPLENISLNDLRQICHKEKKEWESGRNILLILRESGSTEREVIQKEIYGINEKQLKEIWLEKILNEEIYSFPKIISSNLNMKQFVSKVAISIGFINATYVDDSVKVLKVEGKFPGEDGYFLRWSE